MTIHDVNAGPNKWALLYLQPLNNLNEKFRSHGECELSSLCLLTSVLKLQSPIVCICMGMMYMFKPLKMNEFMTIKAHLFA